jgi:hypothetical protein
MKRLILGPVARLDGALTHALLRHAWRLLAGRDRWWSGAVQAAATRAVLGGGAPARPADADTSGGLAHHEVGRQRDRRGGLAGHEAEQQADHLGADAGERLADRGERRL